MGAMSVSPGRVIELAEEVRRNAQGIQDHLTTLESKITKLRPSWSGQAQAAYDEAQIKWNKELSAMQQLLETIASKTIQISEGYTSTDSQAAKRFAI